FTYAGSWTGLGVSVGLFSAALGWALQKPITGIAGWIMVVLKRPFEIGDRIIIGNVRGDVEDISLTHIYVKEIGGIIGGEENSGRVVMIPNSKLFEQDITNYTQEDEYILDQVSTIITYESNIDKAMKIAVESAKKHTKEVIKKTKKQPYALTYFDSNGINLRVRYFSPTKKLQRISSAVTKEIYDMVSKEKDLRFAYPHNEVILNKKK
ncbi:mechanosensitive ion channel, partial [Candidatus Woesearchaeota archaeon]|nr:mechanosensitive ion channel [Candidatus Woesearchaeota archaeon]